MKSLIALLFLGILSSVQSQLFGVSYGVQRPDGSCSSYDQILTDFRLMKTYTNRVRIFTTAGCSGGYNSVKAGLATGIQVMLSVQTLPEDAYAADKAALQQIYSQIGFSNVIGVILGSEDLYRNAITADLLTQKIYDVKGFLKSIGANVPVTHADVYYLQPAELIAAEDIVMFNAYPYWEGVSVEGALAAFQNHYSYVQSIAQGKPIWIGETGWADQGAQQANAVASMDNFKKYLNDFVCWANSINLPYLWFEAFDEPWKGTGVEEHWGLYYPDHVTKKPGFQLTCGGSSPTSSPTSAPTSSPTSAPTSAPTSSPTSNTNTGTDLPSALYYSFDEKSTSTVTDRSGNGRTGTVSGSGISYIAGVSGSAARFSQNPSRTYIAAQNANSFANQFSVSLWFRVESQLDVRMKLSSSKLNWNDPTGWELEYYPIANTLNFVGSDGSVASWNAGLGFGVWNFVAVSVNGNAVTMYTNGAQLGNVQYVSPVKASTRSLYVGSNGQADALTGSLDEFHIFNLVLSANQVRSVYQGTPVTQAPTSQAPTSQATSQAPTSRAPTSQATSRANPTSAPTSAPTSTPTPSSSSSSTGPTCSVNTCGAAGCCPTSTGNQCFNVNNYSCVSDQATSKVQLCPLGYASCNGACYSPSVYKCANGGLAPK